MYLGIDLGTSSVKGVVLNENTILDQASFPLDISRPQALWSEQDPADWWAATVSVIQALDPKYRSQIKTIGLAGQMHGAVILGKNDRVLRPAILWNDARSQQECLELTAKVPDLETQFGNKLMPGFTSPKLAWIKKHEPELFDQIEKVLLPKDYIRLKLSGNYATDMSDAAGTGWLDVKARAWSETLLAGNDLKLSTMPTLYEGTELTGKILPEVATELGLSPEVSIAAGGGDNAAAAVSMNVIENGSAFLSLGTSGVYFVSSDCYQPNPEQGVHMFAHCLPQTWHSMNCHLSATNCLTWLAELTQSEIVNLLEQAED